ncbi:CBS domain-containing protein [Caldiplasma sukawensis]
MLPTLQEIAKMRKSLGLSQKEVAMEFNLSQSYIARMEKGDINPSYENVKKIYDYLYNFSKKTRNIEIPAERIMTSNVICCFASDYTIYAIEKLKNNGISQMPVLNENSLVVGTISEEDINNFLLRGHDPSIFSKMPVSRVMGSALPQLPGKTPISVVYPILRHSNAVLITDKLEIKGIITKADILKAVENYAVTDI